MEDLKRENLILGALLHDIGKFAYRAGLSLSEEDKRDAELFCPKNKAGYPIHLHSVLSAKFIKEIFEKKYENASNFVLRHHNPSEVEDKIIQLSDWLSSAERRDREEDEKTEEVKKEPLISIFSKIVLDGVLIEKKYHSPVALSGDFENLFPFKNKEEALNQKNSFESLWKDFYKEAKIIFEEKYKEKIFFIKLLKLLEKYTLFIPSSAYKDEPSISLFHHLKSSCAIATCLYDLKIKKEEIDEILLGIKNENYEKEILKRKDFLLLGGDLTGIQNFIYSISTEKALKSLRARSFYLQLINEIIPKMLLEEFNLTYANLLYCGGGHFTILLPNIKEYQKKIGEIYDTIINNLFISHKGKLGIVFGKLEISYKDFFNENFSLCLEKLGKIISKEKKKKFSSILNENFFEPFEEGGEKRGCEICGEEIEEKEKEKCSLCESFEDLGLQIKNAKLISQRKIGMPFRISRTSRGWFEIFKSFGFEIKFSKSLGEVENFEEIYKINETNFYENKKYCGFKFEPFYSPEGTLEDISDKAEGIKKWGALRMDVDNLGKIFKEGLKDKTISRMNMLSHMFSQFFSQYIRDIVEKNFKEKAIVVYSGGDDLFILACWDLLPVLAKSIYYGFKKYTCEHKKITLSAGVFISPSSGFPVFEAAEEAGNALDLAKAEGKNKINFLGKNLLWDELLELEKIKDKILNLMEGKDKNKKMPHSLLTILYKGYENQENYKKGKASLSLIWLFLYGLKRLGERFFKKEEEWEGLLNLREIFMQNNELKKNLDIAVRWADYLIRK